MKRSTNCPPCCTECAWGKGDVEKSAPVPAATLKLAGVRPYDTACGPGFLGRTAGGALVRLEQLGNALMAREQVRPGGVGLSASAMAC